MYPPEEPTKLSLILLAAILNHSCLLEEVRGNLNLFFFNVALGEFQSLLQGEPRSKAALGERQFRYLAVSNRWPLRILSRCGRLFRLSDGKTAQANDYCYQREYSSHINLRYQKHLTPGITRSPERCAVDDIIRVGGRVHAVVRRRPSASIAFRPMALKPYFNHLDRLKVLEADHGIEFRPATPTF
jgi:hypothetical protein